MSIFRIIFIVFFLFLSSFSAFAQWERELFAEGYTLSVDDETNLLFAFATNFHFYDNNLWFTVVALDSGSNRVVPTILTKDNGHSFHLIDRDFRVRNLGFPIDFLNDSTILFSAKHGSYIRYSIFDNTFKHLLSEDSMNHQPIIYRDKAIMALREYRDFSTLFQSYDAGETWNEITLPVCNDVRVEFYPCGENRICLACINPQADTLQLHVSRDEGTSWETLPTISPQRRGNGYIVAENTLHVYGANKLVENYRFPPLFYDPTGQAQESSIDEKLRLLADSTLLLSTHEDQTGNRDAFYVHNNLLYTFYRAYHFEDTTALNNSGGPYGDEAPKPIGDLITVTDLATKTTKLSLFQHYEEVANRLNSKIITFADSEELGVIMYNDFDVWLYKTQDRGQTPAIFGEPTPRDGDSSGGGDIPTALENAPLENTLKLWPNPSSGILRLSGTGAFGVLNVFDALGRKRLSFPAQPAAQEVREINLNGLSSGLYFLEVESEKGRIRKSFVVE